jgi:hypothetical protein
MPQSLNPVQVRRLLARTLRVALDGGPAHNQLIERWAHAHASEARWVAALTWDGVGAAVGWALTALDLRGVAPPEMETPAAVAYEEARSQSVQLTAYLGRLGVELNAAGIPSIALKGSALLVSNVAPAHGLRWMGDLDILVPEPQVEPAAWVLESLDYVRAGSREAAIAEPAHPYHDSFVGPDGQVVELHWRLGPARWGDEWSSSGWFSRAVSSSVAGMLVPSAADLFWHFLFHDARNHAWSSGSLRAALDLALAARARGFELGEILRRLEADPRPAPLLDGVADAANLSPILAAEIEPSPQPRYLRLGPWRDTIGRRRWATSRIAEAVAWGATLDRARRFGGWHGVFDRALGSTPEASPGTSLVARLRRAFVAARHAGFVAALAGSHYISVPGERQLGGEARAQPRLTRGS